MALFLLRNAQIAKQQTGSLGILCLKASYSSDARVLPTTNLSALKRGTGGRSSFNGLVVTIFGSTGFMGRAVANKFGKIGSQLILAYRGDSYDAGRLKLVGDLGQVLFHFYHLRDEASIRDAVKYSNVVVNLVGRDWKTKNFTLNDVNVEGARRIARICREQGVERLIHLSALNADPNPEPVVYKNCQFRKTKYYGELAVLEEFPNATIFRPADTYGRDDDFCSYYAHMWRHQFRGMPLWQKGEKTIKQPVFVGDLAQAIVNAAKDPDTAGRIYQAVGPRRYVLADLIDWFHEEMRKDAEDWGYRRYDMRFDPAFFLKVWLSETICTSQNIGNVHRERIEREFVTDKVDASIPTLEDLGVDLTLMEDQIPWEMRPFRAFGYYAEDVGDFSTPVKPKFIDPRDIRAEPIRYN